MTRPRFVPLFLFVLSACATAAPASRSVAYSATGTVVADTVWSASLEGNPLGDPARRSTRVYLPPGYDTMPRTRYPVLYLLHGFDGTDAQWLSPRAPIPLIMDSLIAAGTIRPMIVVMPDGKNAYGGSFFVNSPATGQWEDFIVRDLVAYVDLTYRTLPNAASRAVAGYSMGGYGALRLGMRHPEVFGTVYALSACCLGPELLDDRQMEAAWHRTLAIREREGLAEAGFWSQFQVALASVFSPSPESVPWGVNFPVRLAGTRLEPVTTVRARWLASTPERMVRDYRSNLGRLRGLAFDVGRNDGFAHIPTTLRALSRALSDNGIPHSFEEYEGDHGNRIQERIRSGMLPFVSATTDFGPRSP
jgi:S-formylglutathione hydrolase